MRMPKKVIISGKTYSVEKNDKTYNSDGFTHQQRIIVGTKGQHPERIFENYLHEVTELAACEQHVRFSAADDDVVIVMNHKQFDRLVADVASSIYPMVK